VPPCSPTLGLLLLLMMMLLLLLLLLLSPGWREGNRCRRCI
jgi:hypothetical protein